MSSKLNGSMVFDTSVLVSIAVDSPIFKAIQGSISNERIKPLTAHHNENIITFANEICTDLS